MEELETNEDSGIKMTKRSISEQCMKHQLYITPEMNDLLYLQYQGYTEIANLDPYVNLKSLWLDNNGISNISGLDAQKQLTSLYLNNNLISDISGLENLKMLKILILSHNSITKIQGLDNCPLNTLDLEGNRIKTANDIEEVLKCPRLKVLNLASNRIDDENILQIIEKLSKLRVLRLDGNPVVRKIPYYRKTLIQKLPNLKSLDNNPVTLEDRRLSEAFFKGGKEAETAERQKISEEKNNAAKDNMKSMRELQRAALFEKGGSLQDYPELLSSDDEDMPRLMKEKYGNLQKENFDECDIFIPSRHNNISDEVD